VACSVASMLRALPFTTGQTDSDYLDFHTRLYFLTRYAALSPRADIFATSMDVRLDLLY
jgi:hypothetical protein